LDFFQQLKEVHKDITDTYIWFLASDEERFPALVNGEKKRFLYLASKLLQNSIVRCSRWQNMNSEVKVEFSICTG
jgi:hypothetical protein